MCTQYHISDVFETVNQPILMGVSVSSARALVTRHCSYHSSCRVDHSHTIDAFACTPTHILISFMPNLSTQSMSLCPSFQCSYHHSYTSNLSYTLHFPPSLIDTVLFRHARRKSTRRTSSALTRQRCLHINKNSNNRAAAAEKKTCYIRTYSVAMYTHTYVNT